MIRLIYTTALLLCFAPLIPGVIGVFLPAISWLPALGYMAPGTEAFRQIIDWPNLTESIALTLFTGFSSTLLALFLTYVILSHHWGKPLWEKLESSLSPMLAMPHVALAISLVLLLSPTGWVFRVLEAMGISFDGEMNLIKDPFGIGLILMLAIKETPFLLIMSIPVLRQLNVQRLCAVSESLGYTRSESWRMVIFPLWMPRLRLPLFAVAAYGLSVVDVALILGPTRPPTLAVVLWQWFNEPDIFFLPRAAAGALLMLGLTAMVLCLMRSVEWFILQKCRQWQTSGASSNKRRHEKTKPPRLPFFLFIPLFTFPILILWSFALRWRFPALLPSQLSSRFWEQELSNIITLIGNSLFYATVSSILALILVVSCLEFRSKYHRGLPVWLFTIPLITPQLSLLFGIQVSTFLIPGQHYQLWVMWSHLIFVFPYLYLTLDGTWRSYDIRLDMCSRSLGKTAWQTWWHVKRPQVQPAIIFGLAVGISVSLAQYLPTQMLGAGRISTLTTEAVALSSGQDRRVMAIYGLLQGILPLVFFSLALFFNRRRIHDSVSQRP
ncbi:ABC transporter permease [Vibrio salinus]|uniref:ABC transporter permease n=1 Tax=Vibrio salinus TaxID=2899784 RepID=UPI001E51D9EC|nr:thiamine ABC transporter permease [Vibrio salinus]MCE0494780.1 thiamine ABC transporter permease [Vibrio salinus]